MKKKKKKKQKVEDNWESALLDVVKILKSTQRRFSADEISIKGALELALEARKKMENLVPQTANYNLRLFSILSCFINTNVYKHLQRRA